MLNTLITSALSVSLLLTPVNGFVSPVAGQTAQIAERKVVLASELMDLGNRYPVVSVSEGFKNNILISLNYLTFQDDVLELKPGEIFAFHKKGILPEFKESKIVSQESDFTTNDGYKVVAGLGGNGVCHLASLIYKTAAKAGLEAIAPTNHNFASISGIEKEFGVSISTRNSPERQNLYIKNNFDFPVEMKFGLNGEILKIEILKVSQFIY